MAASYVMITDSACDILPEKLKEWDVELIRLPYLFTDDGKEHLDQDQPMHEFYNEMREGRVAKTSGINEDTFQNVFTPFLEAGKDILYLAFSSGLSVTCERLRRSFRNSIRTGRSAWWIPCALPPVRDCLFTWR